MFNPDLDVIMLAARTDSAAGAEGVTLFLLDTSLPGFRRGKNLKKLGMKAQDTSEADQIEAMVDPTWMWVLRPKTRCRCSALGRV